MRRFVRSVLWILLACVALSVVSVLMFRWVNPPYSAFMAESQISAWANRDRDYVYRRTWADLARI
jgi:monofunctional biosynthetic peptidoglycan transglycosylase